MRPPSTYPLSHLFLLLFLLSFLLFTCEIVRGERVEERGESVVIIGGGVSGLTAAHELIERGYSVQVFERQGVFGGKARSYDVEGTGENGREDLPGEHGFRIFWNYYLNVFDTLSRINYNQTLTVFDYMVEIANNELLTDDGVKIYIDFGPQNWNQFLDEIRNLSIEAHFLSTEEAEFGIERMEILLTTCDDRMREEYEHYSVAEFFGAQYRSKNFTEFFLELLHLGAMTADKSNLGTTANYVKSLNSPWNDNIAIKVLKKPTNEAWIDPWVNQMTAAGGQFYSNMTVQSFTCSGGEMNSVTILDNISGKTSTISADYFIFAVPVNNMLSILGNSKTQSCTPLKSLAGLPQLLTTWMAGMQYYLYEDVPITDGFALYVSSPWSLTTVSFHQWWPDVNWKNLGTGNVTGIISAIISNFTAPGILFNKTALECTQAEIQAEVWAQLKAHLNINSEVLKDSNVAGFALDTSLIYVNGTLENEEVMFYASPDSWVNSPTATTEFNNLFMCGDYVQTMSRVTPSTMEAANESARRAVNALLEASKSSQTPVNIFPPPRNPDFEPLILEDEARFKLGLPHTGCKTAGCVVNS